MRTLLSVFLFAASALAQAPGPCSCGANPPGRPETRTLAPYATAPDDLRPYSRFTKPYYEHYTKTVEYNGPARDVPVPTSRTSPKCASDSWAPFRITATRPSAA